MLADEDPRFCSLVNKSGHIVLQAVNYDIHIFVYAYFTVCKYVWLKNLVLYSKSLESVWTESTV